MSGHTDPTITLTRTQVELTLLLVRWHDRVPHSIGHLVDLTDPATSGGQTTNARATNWHATMRMTAAKLDRALERKPGAVDLRISFSANQVERTLAVFRYWQRQALTAMSQTLGIPESRARTLRDALPVLIATFADAMRRDPLAAGEVARG